MRIDRRLFLKSTAAAVATLSLPLPAAAGTPVKLGKLATLTAGQPVSSKLSDGTPVVVLKLGAPCDGGVGPDRDVVGFVPVCTHLGCVVSWTGGRFVCPCHASQFDAALGGQCYQGPATAALPRLRLRVEGEDIESVGVDGVTWNQPTTEPA